MHIRQKIRDAAITRLSGLNTTGARVFRHFYTLTENDYPGLRLTTWDETSGRIGDLECGQLLRSTQLIVEAWATGGDEIEDTLDLIAEEIEIAIDADDTLGVNATDAILQSTEKSVDVGGDRRVGRLSMTFIVRTATPVGDPTTAA